MKITWLPAGKYLVTLETDEKVDLDIYVVNLGSPAVTSIEDLLALMIAYLCDHCTDILEEPEIDASDNPSS